MLEWQVIIAAVVGIIALSAMGLAISVGKQNKKLSQLLQQQGEQVDGLKYQLELQKEELHEVRSGALAVGNKVKELMVKTDLLSDKVQEIEYLDPETRLYAQATKMVDAGASVEELMQECDLPRAEAELLLSVKKQP